MSRAAVNDLMQGFRFHVTAATTDGADPLAFARTGEFEGAGQAGFQSVTIPEISVEASEYREGTFLWTQKYPGPPTVSECTLMRGVAKYDTTFYHWVRDSIDGDEYRCDVTIWHYQRTEMGLATSSETSDDIRRIECKNCFGMRAKPMGDLDSMAADVSLGEVDFGMESFSVGPPLQGAGTL
jgi:phage tail-like protein